MSVLENVRIDDRLIHGQIVTAWINALHTKKIVVIDDKAASDELQKMMLEMATPSSISLHIFSVADAIPFLQQTENGTKDILFVFRNADTANRLVEAGVQFLKINVGNVSSSPKRKMVSKSIWLAQDDIDDYVKLRDHGISLSVQVVPNEKSIELFDLIQK